MPKAVRYDGEGQVLVRVKAAGINPSEAVIRTGASADLFPSTFPSGQGSDLAGVIGRGIAAGPGAKVLARLAGLIADGHRRPPAFGPSRHLRTDNPTCQRRLIPNASRKAF